MPVYIIIVGDYINNDYDVTCELTLNVYEAVQGCVKNINFDVFEDCIDCRGTGCSEFNGVICDKCDGIGSIEVKKFSIFGSTKSKMICDKCKGIGKLSTNACKVCGGYGTIRRAKYLTLKIPKDTRDGQIIKKIGFGKENKLSKQFGDLVVKIKVKK